MSKRPAEDSAVALIDDSKKIKTSKDVANFVDGRQVAIPQKRHSLRGSIMQLLGHDGEILTCRFHPSGDSFVSAGMDRCIFLWKATGNCKNVAVYNAAHANAILDMNYSAKGDKLITCSADKTVAIWDLESGCRLKKLRSHQSYVNSISVAQQSSSELIVSVGDDGYINVWDLRKKKCAASFQDTYPLLAVSFNLQGDQVFTGGIENTINVWDLRRNSKHDSLIGHSDSITGLSLSPDGDHLLSNCMDNTLKCWDIKPYSPINRLEKTFLGHQHNFEKNLLRCAWSRNGSMVTAGSADRNVHVWSYYSCDILYKLPGHKGSVNEVVFSPSEPLILSCSSDKQMYIGEINDELI